MIPLKSMQSPQFRPVAKRWRCPHLRRCVLLVDTSTLTTDAPQRLLFEMNSDVGKSIGDSQELEPSARWITTRSMTSWSPPFLPDSADQSRLCFSATTPRRPQARNRSKRRTAWPAASRRNVKRSRSEFRCSARTPCARCRTFAQW